MPRVLISDKLESPGLDLLRQAGIELDERPGLKGAALKDALRAADGVIVRSGTQRHRRAARQSRQAAGHRPRRRRRGQHRRRRRHAQGHRRHEHARRQHRQHRRADHHPADGPGPPHPRRRRHVRAAGKWERSKFVGTPAGRQDARRRRPGPHRPRGRPPRRRPGHEGASASIRSSPPPRRPARHRDRRRPRCPAAALRFPHRPHAADRRDAQPDRRRAAGPDAQGRPRHQLRPRRHHQRGGPGRGAASRATSPAPPWTCSCRSRRPPIIRS